MGGLNKILYSMMGFGTTLIWVGIFFGMFIVPDCNDNYYSNCYIYGQDVAYNMLVGCDQGMIPLLYVNIIIMCIACILIYLPIVIWIIKFVLWAISLTLNRFRRNNRKV